MKNFDQPSNTIETQSEIEAASKNIEKYFLPPLNEAMEKFLKGRECRVIEKGEIVILPRTAFEQKIISQLSYYPPVIEKIDRFTEQHNFEQPFKNFQVSKGIHLFTPCPFTTMDEEKKIYIDASYLPVKFLQNRDLQSIAKSAPGIIRGLAHDAVHFIVQPKKNQSEEVVRFALNQKHMNLYLFIDTLKDIDEAKKQLFKEELRKELESLAGKIKVQSVGAMVTFGIDREIIGQVGKNFDESATDLLSTKIESNMVDYVVNYLEQNFPVFKMAHQKSHLKKTLTEIGKKLRREAEPISYGDRQYTGQQVEEKLRKLDLLNFFQQRDAYLESAIFEKFYSVYGPEVQYFD